MKTILYYIKDWLILTDKRVLLATSLLTALLVFLNYFHHLDSYISAHGSFTWSLLLRYVIFFLAFALPYLFYRFIAGKPYPSSTVFVFLILLAPLLFSLKTTLTIDLPFTGNAENAKYWNYVLYWPLLVLLLTLVLYILWRLFDSKQPFYGLTRKNLDWKPYIIMLLIMLPLVALASTQPDFLVVYPKLKSVTSLFEELGWWKKLLFEISYGSDFFTIELFFRGFLVLAFIKWAGQDVILPMACFYCTIHFGKPLGECISSYFGGILLGIIVSNTRSIYGGLLVHLGIAWLMELGGYIGNSLK